MKAYKKKHAKKAVTIEYMHGLCIVWIICMVCEMFVVFLTTRYISSYNSDPLIVVGRLEDVEFGNSSSHSIFSDLLTIRVNGDSYYVRDNFSMTKTFGINYTMAELKSIMDNKVGEYIQIKYIKSGISNIVIGLTIDNIEYVNEQINRKDNISSETNVRNIAIALFLFTAIALTLTITKIVRQKLFLKRLFFEDKI